MTIPKGDVSKALAQAAETAAGKWGVCRATWAPGLLTITFVGDPTSRTFCKRHSAKFMDNIGKVYKDYLIVVTYSTKDDVIVCMQKEKGKEVIDYEAFKL